MKTIRIFIVLFVCFLHSAYACAASCSINGQQGEYTVSVSGTDSGASYVLLWCEGNVNYPSTSQEVLYIAQKQAEGTTLTFGNVQPRPASVSTVFVIDSGGNVVYAGHFSGVAAGDVDLNGTVDQLDMNLLLDYLAGLAELSFDQFNAADLNRSGNISIYDAYELSQ